MKPQPSNRGSAEDCEARRPGEAQERVAPDSGPPAVTALDLELLRSATPERWLAGRNATKADIGLYSVGDRRVAVKTYAKQKNRVRRLLGRWLIGREAAAYRAAAGVEGLPRFFGCPDPLALATEWVPGLSVPELGRHRLEGRVFDAVEDILRALHSRGVALADLHHRNVLVTEDGRVYLLDLAAALALGPRPGPIRRALFRRMCELDFLALARMRARWTGGKVDAAVAEVGGSIAKWHRAGRRVKSAVNFLRGKRRG